MQTIFQGYFRGAVIPKGRARFSTRNGMVRTYTPKETEDYEELLSFMFKESYGNKKPAKGALKVDIVMWLEKPPSIKRKHPSVRPDIDNYLKAILDAANKIVWKDDGQVVCLHSTKMYANDCQAPGFHIEVSSLD